MTVSAKFRMMMASQLAGNHRVFKLKCGTVGSAHSLLALARKNGYNGAASTFYDRLGNSDGAKTIKQLSVPTATKHASTKKRQQSEEVASAIAALDARKAAMRGGK